MTHATKHPKALFPLFFASMWECFSYYGMRALLVMYMIEELGFNQSTAFGIYGLYTMLSELLALAGGYCADKVWGMRRSIYFGGALIVAGHLCLALQNATPLFYIGLGSIVVGTSLFKPNLKGLLGTFYNNEDRLREAGFTLFYTGMNIGGFAATIGCSFAATLLGWHVGFGLAAFGMLLGLGMLIAKNVLLKQKGTTTFQVVWKKKAIAISLVFLSVFLVGFLLQQQKFSIYFILLIGVFAFYYLLLQIKKHTSSEKKSIHTLLSNIFLLMLYFTMSELIGSLLVVFLSDYVTKTIGKISIPSTLWIAANPLGIILLGALFAKKLGAISHKIACSFGCIATAFFFLFVGCQLSLDKQLVSFLFPLISFAIIALGELFIAPTIYAQCSKNAPNAIKGIMMGTVSMGFSYASFFSALLAKYATVNTLAEYSSFFLTLAMLSGGIASFLFLLKKRKKLQTGL